MADRRLQLFGALVATALIACDSGFAPPAPARCTEAGEQCQLSAGPLGVCERSACAAGEAAPCFQCTPQH